MSWFPVDDAFHSHPKARKAGMEAIGLWTLAGSHCMAYLTDGFVADWWIKEKPRGTALAKRLASAGLWSRGECDGEQGYWFHDWKPECTKAHVLSARENARKRKQKQRESQGPSRVTAAVTDNVSPASCLVPTQPNPTQPINPVEILGGGVTSVDAREPRPHCPDHEENSADPCPACLRRRKWDETHADELNADELDAKRRRKWLQENCSRCHGTNTYEDADGKVRTCQPHQESAHG